MLNICGAFHQITGSCVDPGLSDKARFPKVFRTSSSEDEIIPTRVKILNHFGWKKVALFHESIGHFPVVNLFLNPITLLHLHTDNMDINKSLIYIGT